MREHDGLRYALDPDVYEPSDDTFLLLEEVLRTPPGRLLEIGTGTGLVAMAAARVGHEVVATDINPFALALARSNARRNDIPLKLLRTSLLDGLRIERFDCIAFNPPYLPTAPEEKVPGPLNAAWDGGLTGRTVVERFLVQLGPTSPPVLLVASSLQDLQWFQQPTKVDDLTVTFVNSRRLAWETLYVCRLAPASSITHETPKEFPLSHGTNPSIFQ